MRIATALTTLVAVAWPAIARADDDKPTLTAVTVTASSTLPGKHDRYAAWHVIDDDVPNALNPAGNDDTHDTQWCEGKSDEGVGEYVELAGDDLSFTALEIAAGFWKSGKLFAANNQPTELTVTVTAHDGTTRSFDVKVPKKRRVARLKPGKLIDATDIRIAFTSIRKERMNDSCLSDVAIERHGATLALIAAPAAAAQSFASDLAAITKMLSSCNAKAIAQWVTFPITYDPLDENVNPDDKQATFADAKAFRAACKLQETPTMRDDLGFFDAIVGPGQILVEYDFNENEDRAWMLLTYDEPAARWRLTSLVLDAV